MRNAKRLLKKQISADDLVEKILEISRSQPVCLLDSGGVSHLNSHLLICGIDPIERLEIADESAETALRLLDEKLDAAETFAIFTIAYEFGLKLENINPRKKRFGHREPDIFLALFDCLLIHDYNSKETFLFGDEAQFDRTERLIDAARADRVDESADKFLTTVESNLTKAEYLEKIERIKEFIRRGDTYQTNLTQQFTAELPENLAPQRIFGNLRKNHPAPFAAFIQRFDSTVISASPERFFKLETPPTIDQKRKITTNPIKGTRPRGTTRKIDEQLRNELLNSDKDRAENVMIVDLLRNDLGRICDFGSVEVEKLCDLEQHPTLFHLVSTVSGNLRKNTNFSEILRAVFPCGSITGAPKIRTMQIIDELETAARGLSMGAIGFSSPGSRVESYLKNPSTLYSPLSILHSLDLSVAIRTMTIRERQATFNVGGGIVIDSIPEKEYEESLVKAKALMNSIHGELKIEQ